MTDHICDRDDRWAEYDWQGIFLCYVCEQCVEQKLKIYRPEIIKGYTQVDVDENIESDDEDMNFFSFSP